MSYGSLLFLLAAVVAVSGQTEEADLDVDEVALRTGGVLASSVENGTGGNCSQRYECASCTESRLCVPVGPGEDGFVEALRAKCKSPTPFCDYNTGSCSAEMSHDCATHDEFMCVRDGTFPHPRFCNKFYDCKNLVSTTYICNYGTYDPKSQKCAQYNSCYKFNCFGKTGVKVPHAVAPEYFAYCSSNTATVVDKCSGSDIFDEQNQTCYPYCETEGPLEDSKDKTSFYSCNYVAGKLLLSHLKCQKHEVFDPQEGRCKLSVTNQILPESPL